MLPHRSSPGTEDRLFNGNRGRHAHVTAVVALGHLAHQVGSGRRRRRCTARARRCRKPAPLSVRSRRLPAPARLPRAARDPRPPRPAAESAHGRNRPDTGAVSRNRGRPENPRSPASSRAAGYFEKNWREHSRKFVCPDGCKRGEKIHGRLEAVPSAAGRECIVQLVAEGLQTNRIQPDQAHVAQRRGQPLRVMELVESRRSPWTC